MKVTIKDTKDLKPSGEPGEIIKSSNNSIGLILTKPNILNNTKRKVAIIYPKPRKSVQRLGEWDINTCTLFSGKITIENE